MLEDKELSVLDVFDAHVFEGDLNVSERHHNVLPGFFKAQLAKASSALAYFYRVHADLEVSDDIVSSASLEEKYVGSCTSTQDVIALSSVEEITAPTATDTIATIVPSEMIPAA